MSLLNTLRITEHRLGKGSKPVCKKHQRFKDVRLKLQQQTVHRALCRHLFANLFKKNERTRSLEIPDKTLTNANISQLNQEIPEALMN